MRRTSSRSQLAMVASAKAHGPLLLRVAPCFSASTVIRALSSSRPNISSGPNRSRSSNRSKTTAPICMATEAIWFFIVNQFLGAQQLHTRRNNLNRNLRAKSDIPQAMKALLPVFLLVFVVAGGKAATAVPPMISYQGRLTADGANYDRRGFFKFALISRDSVLWSNDGSREGEPDRSVSLDVRNGLFSVQLGDPA